MEDFIVQFKGFSPSNFARDYVHDVISKLHEEAPLSSLVRVTISKVGKHAFRGLLRINSPNGPVFSLATGKTLAEVSHQLTERARRQLDKWKSRRFNHDTIRKPGHHDEDGSRAG